MNINRVKTVVLAMAVGHLMAGCVAFTGLEMPGDDEVDERNQALAIQQAKDHAARSKFKRKVVITKGDGIAAFLGVAGVLPQNKIAVDKGDQVCANVENRRQLLVFLEAKLTEEIGKLKDFDIQGVATPDCYQFVYNVSSIGLKPTSTYANQQTGEVTVDWTGSASLDLRLRTPDGKVVFTYTGDGTGTSRTVNSGPKIDAVQTAIGLALKRAMTNYEHEMAPPMYVVQTCQGGQFAQLSAGQDYGLKPGQAVEFYYNKAVKAPDGTTEYRERHIGSGVIGKEKSMGVMRTNMQMMDRQHVWVFVNDFDPEHPELRQVRQWTSAKVKWE